MRRFVCVRTSGRRAKQAAREQQDRKERASMSGRKKRSQQARERERNSLAVISVNLLETHLSR